MDKGWEVHVLPGLRTMGNVLLWRVDPGGRGGGKVSSILPRCDWETKEIKQPGRCDIDLKKVFFPTFPAH